MAFIDYYKVLGINSNATDKEIKKAYRKQARKYHPDVNPNDPEAQRKFQEVNEANEVLSNPDSRKKYDQYGQDWKHADEMDRAKQQRHQQQSRRQDYGGFGGDASGYSDFFESMFGGGRGNFDRSTTFKGQDFNATLQLQLTEVYTSQKRTLTIQGKNIRLTIPAGVEDKQTIKIKGYGGEGVNGGPNGDLYITFNIVNNTQFKRDKGDLYHTVALDVYTAVLGGEITVDTFNGKVKLNVKPGTQNTTKVKLKGKGFPHYKKEGFGDFYITYQIVIPEKLSAKEKELFTELSKLQTP